MAVSDPHENHRTFERCWNARDVDGLLALYDENAVYVASAEKRLTGHAEIREMLDACDKAGAKRQTKASGQARGAESSRRDARQV